MDTVRFYRMQESWTKVQAYLQLLHVLLCTTFDMMVNVNHSQSERLVMRGCTPSARCDAPIYLSRRAFTRIWHGSSRQWTCNITYHTKVQNKLQTTWHHLRTHVKRAMRWLLISESFYIIRKWTSLSTHIIRPSGFQITIQNVFRCILSAVSS